MRARRRHISPFQNNFSCFRLKQTTHMSRPFQIWPKKSPYLAGFGVLGFLACNDFYPKFSGVFGVFGGSLWVRAFGPKAQKRNLPQRHPLFLARRAKKDPKTTGVSGKNFVRNFYPKNPGFWGFWPKTPKSARMSRPPKFSKKSEGFLGKTKNTPVSTPIFGPEGAKGAQKWGWRLG